MKAVLSAFALMTVASGVSFSASAASPFSCDVHVRNLTPVQVLLSSGQSALAKDDDDPYTACYLECKPQSGGDEGDSYTRCFNDCLERHQH